jgi:hypothetical protein
MSSDEAIQEAILTILCEQFQRAPGTIILNGESVVEDVTDELSGVADEAVIAQFQLLYNERAIDFTQTMGGVGTIELEAGGIEAYERMSGESVIPKEDVDAVIEALAAADVEPPTLSRDELLERTELDEDPLDMVVWYLEKEDAVDAQIRVGRPWYASVELTAAGREMVTE